MGQTRANCGVTQDLQLKKEKTAPHTMISGPEHLYTVYELFGFDSILMRMAG